MFITFYLKHIFVSTEAWKWLFPKKPNSHYAVKHRQHLRTQPRELHFFKADRIIADLVADFGAVVENSKDYESATANQPCSLDNLFPPMSSQFHRFTINSLLLFSICAFIKSYFALFWVNSFESNFKLNFVRISVDPVTTWKGQIPKKLSRVTQGSWVAARSNNGQPLNPTKIRSCRK